MILSICIPTFNRNNQLENCLNSILISKNNVKDFQFEVCISDNFSEKNPIDIIEKFKDKIDIKFNRNEKNLGYASNALKAVSMASGEYSWISFLIGEVQITKKMQTSNSIMEFSTITNFRKLYFDIN